MAEAGSRVEIDVNPLIPLVLHAAGEQLVIQGQKTVLSLRPVVHVGADEAVVVYFEVF